MAFLKVNFFSNVLGINTAMNVILPQQKANHIGMKEEVSSKSYPVLYLLHGMSDDESIWMRRTSIERYASEYGFAVIMPTTGLGWYTDTTYGLKYWTFISEELPRICKEFFANISDEKEDTFVAGLSMGGYGAFKLALANPKRFKASASISGALNLASESSILRFKENKSFWEGIFGPLENIRGSKNDLFYLSDSIVNNTEIKVEERPKFYLCCGTEDFLYQSNLEMEKKMLDLGLSIESHYLKGNHNWSFWDLEIQNVLNWFDKLRSNK
ncbi:alpha/beta hydrolase family protein [Clostridium sp.]|uniref:alpha/beta hydrolase n=1 Tax=Clostridium sp. TaxID=1506 RepID=UPI0025BC2F96|nr:alpha/beta hydrolase family protein [Clostridium sp.]